MTAPAPSQGGGRGALVWGGLGCGLVVIVILCVAVIISAFFILRQGDGPSAAVTPTAVATAAITPVVATTAVPTAPAPAPTTVPTAPPKVVSTAVPTAPPAAPTAVAPTAVAPAPGITLAWIGNTTANTVSGPIPGGVSVEIRAPGINVVKPSTNGTGANVAVGVTVRQVQGPPLGDFGITLREQNSDNLYQIAIDGDGDEWTVYRKQDGRFNVAGRGPLPAGLVRTQGDNRVEVRAVGDVFTVSVNGQQVGTATDGTFRAGLVGLGVESGPGTGTGASAAVVHFVDWTLQVLP